MAETICSAHGPIYKADYRLIMAAGHDRASQLMRKAARAKRSDEDYDACCDLVDSLSKSAAERFPIGLFVITDQARKAA